MAELEKRGRQFEAITFNKFKGVNFNHADGTNTSGSTYGKDSYGNPEIEAQWMQNFNIHRDGYLTKRRGITRFATIPGIVTNGPLRLIGIQRHVETRLHYLHYSDNAAIWRVRYTASGVGDDVREIMMSGQHIAVVTASFVEWGGSGSPYSCIAVRQGVGNGLWGVGGVFTINGSSPDAGAYAPNSPTGTHLNYFKRRFWVVNSTGTSIVSSENTLWFSEPENPGAWGGSGLPNNIPFDKGDGDYLVATAVYNDTLLVFKTRKTYVLTADGDPTAWTVRLVSDRVGCIGKGTIKSINGFIYFLSLDGVYKTDGTTFELISQPVRDFIDINRNFANPSSVIDLYASYWDNKYILWLTNPNGTSPLFNFAAVYDIPTETWGFWRLADHVTVLGEARFPDMYPDILYLGAQVSSIAGNANAGKYAWSLGQKVYTDDGLNYGCTWQSGKMPFDNPGGYKRNHWVGVSCNRNYTNPGLLQLRVTADDQLGYTTAIDAPPSKASVTMVKCKGAGYGRYFQMNVDHSGPEYMSIYDMTWMMENRGQIPANRPFRDG